MIHPVMPCGGYGTRLWPLSRRDFPKPFTRLPGLPGLPGGESLLQASARRFMGDGFAAPLVVSAADVRDADIRNRA